VPQHVRVRFEIEAGRCTGALDQLARSRVLLICGRRRRR
jgi:hypothetical protein